MINVICNAEVLKLAFKALNTLVNDARFHFKDEGVHVRAVDPANVAMVLIDIPRESFDAYVVDEERTIGMDVNRIKDILKSAKKKDLAELKVDESIIYVKIGHCEYSTAIIDPSAIRKDPNVPELDLPAKVVMDAGVFKTAIKTADEVADEVVFRCDEAGFYIEAKGDVDAVKVHLGEAELIEFNKAEAKSMFSIEYLKEFCKIASAGDVLTIYLGNNYPARMVFEVAEGRLKVEYILAPRIEASE